MSVSMRISRNPQQVIQQPRSSCEKVLGAAGFLIGVATFVNANWREFQQLSEPFKQIKDSINCQVYSSISSQCQELAHEETQDHTNLMLAVGALFLSVTAFYTVSRYATLTPQNHEQEVQASIQEL